MTNMKEFKSLQEETLIDGLIFSKLFSYFFTFRSIILILSFQTNDNHLLYFKDVDQLKIMLAFNQFEEPDE